MTSLDDITVRSMQSVYTHLFSAVHSFNLIHLTDTLSNSGRNEHFKKVRKCVLRLSYVQILWFKFDLASSNGVGCSKGAYTHTHIHT